MREDAGGRLPVTTDAETGEVPLQARNTHPGAPEDWRLGGKGNPLLVASQRAQTYKHFDCRLPASGIVRG